MSSKLEIPPIQTTPTTEPSPPAPQDTASRDVAFKRARERAQALQGLYVHLLVYTVINSGLFLINWVTRGTEGAWWFYWPLLGWGVGLAIHVMTIVSPIFSPEWADRRAERMLGRPERRG
jgi:hypothetical protein